MIKRKKLFWIASALVAVLIVVASAGAWWYQSNRIRSAADCTSVEKFDAAANTCYYDCTSQEQCDELARRVDDELNAFFKGAKVQEAAKTAKEEAKPGKITYINKLGNLNPSPPVADARLWDLFGRISGKDVSQNAVASFIAYNDDQDSTAAAVWRAENPSQWHVTVNKAYEDNLKDLTHTLVHESAHILTLNIKQVPESVEGTCPHLSLSEGCANQSAYINTFYQKFWSQYGGSVPSDEGQNQDEVAEFYDAHGQAENFVSQYAATNVTEDAAESFAHFVLAARPVADSVRDQKIKFFYDYKELVDLRNQIRSNIAKELSARKLLR